MIYILLIFLILELDNQNIVKGGTAPGSDIRDIEGYTLLKSGKFGSQLY